MAASTQIEIQDFSGFSPEAFRFLRSLKRNNHREWFQPRKEEYQRPLQFPLMAVVFELAELCKVSAPEIRFDPHHNVLRIYRDTRFSKDKTPYKTFIAASFPYGTHGKNMESPGLYLQVASKEVYIGGGLYQPTSLQLRKIREAIQRDPQSFLDIVENREFIKHFGQLQGEKLKTAPRGILPDNEMIEYLRMKQFFVSTHWDEETAQRKDFPRKVAKEFKAIMPLLRWIQKAQSLW